MPRYHFVVHAVDHTHDDPNGLILPGLDAASEHGHQIIGELKQSGYHPSGATLHVLDETGRMLHAIPF
jgi:hypothetical protein